MKHSAEQTNYLAAVAIFDTAMNDYLNASNEEEMAVKEKACFDAGDLMELRQVELFKWAKEKVKLLCKVLGKNESELASVLGLYDTAIKGEWIHPRLKDELINRSLQIAVK